MIFLSFVGRLKSIVVDNVLSGNAHMAGILADYLRIAARRILGASRGPNVAAHKLRINRLRH